MDENGVALLHSGYAVAAGGLNETFIFVAEHRRLCRLRQRETQDEKVLGFRVLELIVALRCV